VGGVAALVVAVLLGGGALLVGPWSGERADAAPAATSASARPSAPDEPAGATGSAPATPDAPAVATGKPDELPPSLPAVPLDAEAAVGNGITASLVSLEAVTGSASGPGNIAGPALRVKVRLTNGTSAPVDAALVSVDLTHGDDQVPASPLDDPSRVPFSGTLKPGATAEGTYVFTVPANDRDVVTVSVGYQAGAPFMVFTGSAA
jgi:hypothetical protein